jgi:hypothetical protein
MRQDLTSESSHPDCVHYILDVCLYFVRFAFSMLCQRSGAVNVTDALTFFHPLSLGFLYPLPIPLVDVLSASHILSASPLLQQSLSSLPLLPCHHRCSSIKSDLPLTLKLKKKIEARWCWAGVPYWLHHFPLPSSLFRKNSSAACWPVYQLYWLL